MSVPQQIPELIIRLLSGGDITIRPWQTESRVVDVKQYLHMMYNLPADRYVLVFQDRVLKEMDRIPDASPAELTLLVPGTRVHLQVSMDVAPLSPGGLYNQAVAHMFHGHIPPPSELENDITPAQWGEFVGSLPNKGYVLLYYLCILLWLVLPHTCVMGLMAYILWSRSWYIAATVVTALCISLLKSSSWRHVISWYVSCMEVPLPYQAQLDRALTDSLVRFLTGPGCDASTACFDGEACFGEGERQRCWMFYYPRARVNESGTGL